MKNKVYQSQTVFFALGAVCRITVFGDGRKALSPVKARISEIGDKQDASDGTRNRMFRGYAAEEAKRILLEAGVTQALVEIGETVVNIGAVRRIGLQDPFGTAGINYAYIDVEEKAVVTSGLYSRGFADHTKSGNSGSNALAAITLIGDNAVQLSALCNTASGLSVGDAMALLNDTDVEAIFVTRSEQVLCTDGLRKRPAERPLRSIAA